MTLPAVRVDLIIQKGAKFYQEFQQVQKVNGNLVPIPLTGYTLKTVVKESFNSTVILHTLTEANEGMIKVNEAEGRWAMEINADKTTVPYNHAVYTTKLIDNAYPTIEIDRIVEGKITYKEGT